MDRDVFADIRRRYWNRCSSTRNHRCTPHCAKQRKSGTQRSSRRHGPANPYGQSHGSRVGIRPSAFRTPLILVCSIDSIQHNGLLEFGNVAYLSPRCLLSPAQSIYSKEQIPKDELVDFYHKPCNFTDREVFRADFAQTHVIAVSTELNIHPFSLL